ncbi:cancer-related nucleoside-triphosphatase-like isoform X2 [Prionailurus viverrinus]|uniref:cancer-related nucleoside-triphosphatase-like isoform X2 n=1 Tax=Prionailurus viverrinus TaxID=61388 RepID=UPI001FF464C1|nr:cancer-related nucleoside-triphosphatase-like isoform X2 [Prionailurus viverrinus]
MARHVFLTGPPGVGKTALVQKASKILKSSGVPVNGFTQKSDREEIGFNVVTSSCTQEVWSRIGSEPLPGKRQCRARQYVVYLTPSEQSPLPVLRNADVRVFSVTKENRNHLSPDTMTCVQSGRK